MLNLVSGAYTPHRRASKDEFYEYFAKLGRAGGAGTVVGYVLSGGGSLRGLAPRICGSGLFGSGSLYTHIHGLGCKTLAAGLKVAPRPDCADSPFELLGRMGALRVRVSPRPFQSSSADPCRKLLLRSMISLLMVFGLRVGMVESPPNSLTACSSARNILPWVLDESATCKLSWGPGWLLTS